MRTVLVLNDGETYSDLSRCKIVSLEEGSILAKEFDPDLVVKGICGGDTYITQNKILFALEGFGEVIGTFT